MYDELIFLAQQAPLTGDSTPLKACLIVVAAAAVIMIVTTIISKKKK